MLCLEFLRQLKSIFAFDGTPARFELTETEYGEPEATVCDMKHYEKTAPEPKESAKVVVFESADDNLDYIKRRFRGDINRDLIIREFFLSGRIRAVVVMLNGLVDSKVISDFIIRDGMRYDDTDISRIEGSIADYAMKHIFSVAEATLKNDFREIETAIMDGQAVVFIDGDTKSIVFDTREYPQRAVEAPDNEKTVLGPNNSFNENIRVNISLIRRLVHTDDLVCEMRRYGLDNSTSIGIMYRDGVANPDLVREVKKRISENKDSSILSTGILEQLIEENPITPIPQMLLTERPDRCASFVTEGHVILLCDGTPMAAILPVTLFALLSTPEDTYSRRPIGTVIRILRYTGALISIILPGIFMAAVMFHHGFLSSEVLNTLIASRKMVFVSIGTELIILLIVFQLVREAGLRVPGSTGQAIGIIGGVLMGQAAVSANLVSTVVLILIALTGLGNFCIADHSTQIAAVYFRLAFILAGWMAGFLGLTVVFSILVAHISSLKSFGVPMLSPYMPKTYSKRQILFRGRIGENRNTDTDYMNEVDKK